MSYTVLNIHVRDIYSSMMYGKYVSAAISKISQKSIAEILELFLYLIML